MGVRGVYTERAFDNQNGLKRMRYKTKKRQKADRMVAYERVLFLAEFPWCWFCENARSECVHEMACGSGNRVIAVQVRLAWASSCCDCNQFKVTDYAIWPLVRQLAAKWINDRKSFDRVAFNRLRGRADNAITMAEIIPHICRLLDGKESRGRF